MALMTAAQSDFVLDHDETKSPVSSKRNAVAAPDTSRVLTSLYVHPIAWTPHHLELLGVHLHRAKPLSRQGMGRPMAALLREPSAAVACLDVAFRISTISLATPRNAARRVWEVLHEDELV
ncbi:hypothetical protein MY11210_006595 [Beauveria gryllotalpidicola]